MVRSVAVPTDQVEREIAALCSPSPVTPRIVVGVDEVGRGALAGPVAVGACAVLVRDGAIDTGLPEGVRDSKRLSPARREALVQPIRESAYACAVGWAEPSEIDERGIVGALSLAAARAIEHVDCAVDAVLMDGNTDVITPALQGRVAPLPQVHLRVKADRDCVSVAAASIIAKVARDRHMCELSGQAPQYGWECNKGYGSAAHRRAIADHGIHMAHRRSWNLLGTDQGELPGVLWDPIGVAERSTEREERQR